MAVLRVVHPLDPDPQVLEEAGQCLRSGGLVAFPTETVYGLGADATNAKAVARVFTAKGRPATDPLIVHVADLASVSSLVTSWPEAADRLAQAFWPGPMTVVLPRSSLIGDLVTAGLGTVGIRMPAHPVALALIRAARVPIAAPSANLFSRPSPTRASHVVDDLGDAIDIVLDAGSCAIGVESTVVDLTSDPPAVLRPGGIALERLRMVLPGIATFTGQVSSSSPQHAPGMLTRHYAPRTPLTLFEGDERAVLARMAHDVRRLLSQRRAVVVLATSEDRRALPEPKAGTTDLLRFVDLGSARNPDGIATHLYRALRQCDAACADRILASQLRSGGGLADAVRDRLRRASAGEIVNCWDD